ncbi:MAG: protocatechuate 3,4-dioxygenase subunit alpha [Acidobacteriota bacterium]
MAGLTPFQTVGPFFDFGLVIPRGETLAGPATTGRHIAVDGTLRDGDAAPITDAVIEVWQANAAGRYRHPDDEQDAPLDPAFDGFGRIATDLAGRFAFTTVVPGRVPGADDALQAPHLVIGILGRGLLTRLITRMYFEDDPANREDQVLGLVPAERRPTLIARQTAPDRYQFDIVLQGANETVFFDV